MSKKNRKNNKIDMSSEGAAFGHNPFATALQGMERPDAPAQVIEELVAQSAPQESGKGWELAASAKLTLRCDSKMRKGRVVTLIEGINGGSKEEMKELAKWLGKRLGCGGKVESEEMILIQGDQRERLPELLTERGAGEVRVL